MKVAITAGGRGMDSEVDPRFGRAPYIILADTESGASEAHENEAANAPQGAGIRAYVSGPATAADALRSFLAGELPELSAASGLGPGGGGRDCGPCGGGRGQEGEGGGEVPAAVADEEARAAVGLEEAVRAAVGDSFSERRDYRK